jgi:hypothetical protein
MNISIADETKLRTYLEQGINDSDIPDFIHTAFKVGQQLKIKKLIGPEKNLFNGIQNKMETDARIHNICQAPGMWKDKCDAFKRMMANNLHLYGGKRKTMKRKIMKRMKHMKRTKSAKRITKSRKSRRLQKK